MENQGRTRNTKKYGVIAVGVVIALLAAVAVAMSTQSKVTQPATTKTLTLDEKIDAYLPDDVQNDPIYRGIAKDVVTTDGLADTARVIVFITGSDSKFTGAIQDSEFRNRSVQGDSYAAYDIVCGGQSGIYSVSFQKVSGNDRALDVLIAQDGDLINKVTTNAAYGMASVAGECHKDMVQ